MIEEKPSCGRAQDDGQKGPHLKVGVPAREPLMRKNLGQDPEFGRAEERTLSPHQTQHHQRKANVVGKQPQKSGDRNHQPDFSALHGDDDASLAEPIRQHTGRERNQDQGQRQYTEGQSGLELEQALQLDFVSQVLRLE